MMRKMTKIGIGLFLAAFCMHSNSFAQCDLFDFYGNPSSSPVWYSCNGNDFTLSIQSPHTIGAYTIDWGDGSPIQNGPGLVPPNAVYHVYGATVDIYTVTFTETSTGCTVTGTVVMEEATNASIQIPVGGLTQACAPQVMEFINSSTNTSTTTTFIWNFGDGSPNETYDYTNLGQTISHTYEKGTVDCETVVTLTAENNCNTVQGGPSNATFNPIRIWDIDDAGITASETVLCFPENTVTYTNTTERNCLFQGNIYQRYEYWNFGDYWGLGYDSIIDWRAWPPTFPHTISYPGLGTYTTTLLDSNLCGIDVATITIQIVPPPTADASADVLSICEGETITFTNSSSSSATDFEWNFDDGTPPVYSGNSTVGHVFANEGTYNVRLIASVGGVGGSCADTAYVPITVLPAPEAVIVVDNTAECDTLTALFTDNSLGTISSWSWDFGNGNTSTAQNPPAQSYTSPGNYNVTLTVEAPNLCKNTDTQIVTVYDSPVADFMVDDVCIGSTGSFLDLSTHAGGDPITSWFWNFGDGNTSTDANASHAYTVSGTYTVSLTVETATCTDTKSLNINVQNAPVASFVPDVASGCAPLEVNFTNFSAGGNTYTWIFGDGSGSAVENATHTFNNFGNADSVYTVRLIARNTFGCTDTSQTTITVHPNAVSQFQTFYTPACDADSAIFLNNSINASSYQWNFGDGSPISTLANPKHLFTNTGNTLTNYTITLIANTAFGCADTSTATISVYPQPSFDFTLPVDSGCAPFNVQFPVVGGAVAYHWSFGDGAISIAPNPSHTYANNTLIDRTYTAQLVATSAFGCNDTATADIVVHPNPITQFSLDRTAGCSPLTVSIENQTILGDSLIWSYGDGTTSDTMAVSHSYEFVNNTNSTITYTISLTAFTENGCSRTFTRDVEVYPNVVADYTHPADGCSPLSFTFDNNSVNGNIYQWDLGNGVVSLAAEPIGGYQNTTLFPDTFDIQLVATSIYGCEDTTRSQIVIYPKPNASIVPDRTTGCSPLDVVFQNNSSTADSYAWNYGDGTFSDTSAIVHAHTFVSTSTAPQFFDVSMVASTDYGCTDTTGYQITVYPDVIAGFTGNPLEGCSPLATNFVNQSFGAATYFWNFGDGNEAYSPNPSHNFVNLTDTIQDYTVTMVAQSGFGCTDTSTISVKVHPNPNVSFVVAGIEGCFPAEFTFGNYSAGASTFHWVYGDGTNSGNGDSLHTHTYVNSGTELATYTVSLTGTSDYGCEATTSLDIDVIPQIIADVVQPPGGCSPYTAEFVNNSVGAFTYYWELGDNSWSVDAEPTHLYTNTNAEDSVYTVRFIASSLWGCGDTLEFDIPVVGQPQAAFVAAPSVQTFPNATVNVANLSAANSTAEFAWLWGDGATELSNDPSTPGSHTYETWGDYTISLVVGNQVCNDTATQDIRINPPHPIADFEGEGTGCMPLVVSFTNTSTYGVSYLWDFGDGTNSNLENPTHTYYQPGTYNVMLTVTGPGGDVDIEIKTGVAVVHPRAEAYFTVNPPVITIPDQVFFMNLSNNATEFTWDFGDGGTSDAFSPYHFYETTGWHGVTLIANNGFNCPDTFVVDQAVRGNVDTRIAFPNAFTPNPNGPSGGYWTVDDMFNNDIFFPMYKGVEEFEMQIFNRWGELLFETRDIRQGWDGYYRGKICQQDVYVWRVKVSFQDGGDLTEMGDVTLIR